MASPWISLTAQRKTDSFFFLSHFHWMCCAINVVLHNVRQSSKSHPHRSRCRTKNNNCNECVNAAEAAFFALSSSADLPVWPNSDCVHWTRDYSFAFREAYTQHKSIDFHELNDLLGHKKRSIAHQKVKMVHYNLRPTAPVCTHACTVSPRAQNSLILKSACVETHLFRNRILSCLFIRNGSPDAPLSMQILHRVHIKIKNNDLLTMTFILIEHSANCNRVINIHHSRPLVVRARRSQCSFKWQEAVAAINENEMHRNACVGWPATTTSHTKLAILIGIANRLAQTTKLAFASTRFIRECVTNASN